jgi:hypothetical protein
MPYAPHPCPRHGMLVALLTISTANCDDSRLSLLLMHNSICDVQLWWETAPPSLQATLWELLSDLPGDVPLLFMATADVPKEDLPPAAASLFLVGLTSIVELGPPPAEERAAFFEEISRSLAYPPLPPPRKRVRVAAPQVGGASLLFLPHNFCSHGSDRVGRKGSGVGYIPLLMLWCCVTHADIYRAILVWTQAVLPLFPILCGRFWSIMSAASIELVFGSPRLPANFCGGGIHS